MTRMNLVRGRLLTLAGLALAVGLLTAGCSQGSYPLDIFYEMHYQPAYKAHEPPRLSVPASAVPWYGSAPPQPTSFAGSGKHIFETNCAMCHGAQGLGDGPVLARMLVDYGYGSKGTQNQDLAFFNPNLTSDVAKSIGRDGMRSWILSGSGAENVMPSFSKLLTDYQIELVLDYVEGCIQDGNAAACQ